MPQWLHLSDFHAGQDDHALKQMGERVVHHIKTQKRKPDFLFFTGDLAQTGTASEIERFWQHFGKPVQAAIGNGIQKRTFTVPGNHDVDRKSNPHFDRQAMLRPNSKAFDPTDAGQKERQILFPRLAAFNDRDQTTIGGAWQKPQGGFSTAINLRGRKVGIVGINTAWLCKGDDDKNQLTPGRNLLDAAIKKVATCEIVIVLGHHPLDWIEQKESRAIQSILGNHHAIYLHGHLHDNWVEPRYGGEGGFLSIQSRAAFQARDGDGEFQNGLLWGRANLDRGNLELQAFKWDYAQQAWSLAGDGFNEKYRKNDFWVYDLPKHSYRSEMPRGADQSNRGASSVKVVLQRKIEKLTDVEQISNVAIRPDGNQLAFSQDDQLFVQPLTQAFPSFFGSHRNAEGSHQQLGIETGPQSILLENQKKCKVTALAYTRDGLHLVSGDSEGGINVWSSKESRFIRGQRLHDDAVTCLAVSSDNEMLATASWDETVKVWNLREIFGLHNDILTPIHEFTRKSDIKQSHRKHGKLPHETEQFQSVAFSPSGKLLASGDQKGNLIIRELATMKKVFEKMIHEGSIHAVEFSPVDEGTVATASDDSRIRIYRSPSGKVVTLGVGTAKHTEGLNSIAFSFDGKYVLSSGRDNRLKLWSFEEEELVWEQRIDGEMLVERVSFFPKEHDFTTNRSGSDISVWRILTDGGVQSAKIDTTGLSTSTPRDAAKTRREDLSANGVRTGNRQVKSSKG